MRSRQLPAGRRWRGEPAYLSRYVFKVGISEERIVRADASEVVFRHRKVDSSRPLTLALAPVEFMRRFLQHVLPRGFMKVRYFAFLSPSFSMPLDEIKGRIEMAHGFAVSAASAVSDAAAPATLQGWVCPHCGGRLRYCSVVLPRPLGSGGSARPPGTGTAAAGGVVCRSGYPLADPSPNGFL